MAAPPFQPAPGEAIADHRLVRPVGRGGMGTVWEAVHEPTGARRALKLLPGAALEPALLARFEREALALARVDAHPHVIRVHAGGIERGVPYLVMELAEGGDLRARLTRGALPPVEAARLVRDLARGVAHVHARGVLHRDLKPDNVLFDAHGTPKLVDFGLARVAGAEALTRTGEILGTPACMAPEQVLGTAVDVRTDVYGLGAILYAALTGRAPFVGGQALAALLGQVAREPPTPVRTLAPETPRELEAVCMACLAKDPGARPPSALALAEALERCLGASGGARRRGLLVAGAALLALGAAGLLLRAPRPVPAAPEPAPVPSPALPPPEVPPPPPGPILGPWARRIAREWREPVSRPGVLEAGEPSYEARDKGAQLYAARDAGQGGRARELLGQLRALAERNIARAQCEVGSFLVETPPEVLRGLGLEGDASEGAEQLWRSAREPGGKQAAGLRLGQLLIFGAPGFPPEPGALDPLAQALLAWGPSHEDRRDLGHLFLARGAPGDLLRGLGLVRDYVRPQVPLKGEPEERLRRVLCPLTTPTPACRLAMVAIAREGWDLLPAPDDPVTRPSAQDRAWAGEELTRLVQAGLPAAIAYASATHWLGAEDPPGLRGVELPRPDPLDLAALDWSPSLRRPRGIERLGEVSVETSEAVVTVGDRTQVDWQRLRRAAGTGFSHAQWVLARMLGELQPDSDLAERRCLEVAAGLEPGFAPQARAQLGRVLLLGQWGPRVPGLGVTFLEQSLRSLEFDQNWEELTQAQACLALAALLGEGVPLDPDKGRAALRGIAPERLRYLSLLPTQPGRAAWLHEVLIELGLEPAPPVGQRVALLERAAAERVGDARQRLEARAGDEPAARAALERLDRR